MTATNERAPYAAGTAVTDRDETALRAPVRRPRSGFRLPSMPASPAVLAPSLVAVVNGVLFVLLRPDVNDLWAARARASAVLHGVGLTYWFSWFGGGSTPGNYSVVTPYLSAYLGTEVRRRDLRTRGHGAGHRRSARDTARGWPRPGSRPSVPG